MRRRGFIGVLFASSVLALGLPAAAQAGLEFITQWGAPQGGELIAPLDVERDNAGNTYVIDAFSRSVHKFDAADNFVVSWGVGGIPTAIGVNETTGEVYVATISAFQPGESVAIKRYDSSGTWIAEFGSSGSAEGQLGVVSGIAVNGMAEKVYVTEQDRVQRFTLTGAFELTWGKDVQTGNANTGAELCVSGCKQGEPGTAEGEFRAPSDVAANSFGVFVTEDANNRVQKFDAGGAFQIMAGRDVLPGGPAVGETCVINCQAGIGGSGNGELEEPRGIDVNNALGVIYVVDQGNRRVQQWSAALTYMDEFGGQGAGDGQFESPDGLAEAPSGNVVVADPALFRVQRFSGSNFHSRFGEPATSTLTIPRGIAAGAGGVYVSDGRDRVLRFDPAGAFLGAFGSTGSAPGQFSSPNGLSTDPAGNLFVADEGNDRIQRFDAGGAFLGSWGSTGTATGQFDSPVDAATGSAGNVNVLEAGASHRIQKFSSIGAFLETWGAPGSAPGQFGGAQGIAADSDGNVYVADTGNDRIQKFDADGTLLTTWGGSGAGNGELNGPVDVAVDSLGNVYVADRDNHRIQRFDSSGNFLGRWGANGGDGSPGSAPGEFTNPISIAVDDARDIYVLDFFNGRVQKFARGSAPPDPLTEPSLTIYGNRRQSARRLRVIVTCGGPPCSLRLTGRLVARGRGGRDARVATRRRSRGTLATLRPIKIALKSGQTKTVALKLKQRRRSLRRIRGVLGRGRRGSAIVRGVAVNDAGRDRAKRRLRLKPPKR